MDLYVADDQPLPHQRARLPLAFFFAFAKTLKPAPEELLPHREALRQGMRSRIDKIAAGCAVLAKSMIRASKAAVRHPDFDVDALFALLRADYDDLKDSHVRGFVGALTVLAQTRPDVKPELTDLLRDLSARSGKKRLDYLQKLAKKADIDLELGEAATDEGPAKLVKLLVSRDDASVRLGLQLAAAELLASLDRRLPVGGEDASEVTVKRNIVKHVDDNELDGLTLARAVYARTGGAITYLLAYAPLEEQFALVEGFVRGTVMDLSGKHLTTIPKVAYAFKDITELDISGLGMNALPAGVAGFKKLCVLRAARNGFRKVSPAIKKLKHLKVLDLSHSSLDLDEHHFLFELPGLRELYLHEAFTYGSGQTLPPAFFRLQHLRRLDLTEPRVGGLTNFPRVREVLEGDPIDLDSEALARDAR